MRTAFPPTLDALPNVGAPVGPGSGPGARRSGAAGARGADAGCARETGTDDGKRAEVADAH